MFKKIYIYIYIYIAKYQQNTYKIKRNIANYLKHTYKIPCARALASLFGHPWPCATMFAKLNLALQLVRGRPAAKVVSRLFLHIALANVHHAMVSFISRIEFEFGADFEPKPPVSASTSTS